MKNVFVLFSISVSLSSFLISCTKSQDAPGDKTNTLVLPAGGDDIVRANNLFAFSLLHATLQQDNLDNNKLISPLSIYLAISMVYNGADNATKDSIAHTLQLSGIDINTLNEVCRSLITQLPEEDSRITLSIANSIWYNKNNYQPLPPFLTTVQDSYKAALQPADFSSSSAANTINQWVADQTYDKIKEIIGRTFQNDLMYLVNAIYFKGAWKAKFPSSNTGNDVFYKTYGTETVPFMSANLTVNTYTDSLLRLVELPYGGGGSYSMYIAMPVSSRMTANELANVMTESMLTNAIHSMDSTDMELSMPKWEYSYGIDDMQPELSLLGMGNAFTGSADFSKMYNSSEVKPAITKAAHKTYIKVDEEGTEAAAATVIVVAPTSSQEHWLMLNHPFVYTIIEKQTGTILFTGILNSPSTN